MVIGGVFMTHEEIDAAVEDLNEQLAAHGIPDAVQKTDTGYRLRPDFHLLGSSDPPEEDDEE